MHKILKVHFSILLLLFSNLSFAQYQGKVFIDDNKNKKLDNNEKGIQGISVSDGLNVVKTNIHGDFELPGYEETRFVFITVPAGYKLSDNHYIKTDEKLNTYNFGITPDSSTVGNKVKLLQITDTETSIYGDWIANIRNFANNQNVGMIIHTGDICYEKGMDFHANQVTSELLQKQIFYGIGNHDLVKGEYGEEMFERLFGPTYYSFDAGPAHFIMTPMPSGDYKPSYTVDQVIRWMRNDLANVDKNKPVIVFNHDLPVYNSEFIIKGEKESINLEKYNLKAWIYGHWHNSFVKKFEGSGVYTISSSPPNQGGIDNSAARFLSIDIDENGVSTITPKYTYLHKHLVITSPSKSNLSLVKNGALYLSTNVYDSENEIRDVKAILYDVRGNEVARENLLPSSDWNWNTTTPFKMNWNGQTMVVQIEASFENGESVIKKQQFQLPSKAAKVITKDNWPELLGNAEHNHSDSKEIKLPLNLAWASNIKGNVWKAAPIFADNKVFIGTIDDANNKDCGVSALDAKSGNLLWHYKTNNSVKNAISYHDGIVMASDAEGFAYAISADSGKLLWQKKLGMNYLPSYVTGGVMKNGIYYTGYGKFLQAIEIATGKTLWENKDWSSGESSPSSITVAGDVLITGSNWNSLFGQDLKTGKLLWKRNDEGLRFRSSTATYEDGNLFVTGLNTLFTLDPKTGENIKMTETEFDFKVMAAPLITKGLIIMPTAENGVVAFDKNTLAVKWHQPTGEALVYSAAYTSPDNRKPTQTVESSVVKWGNKLLFGASDGFLYVLDESNGSVLEKINLGAPIFSEISISGNTCFVADFGGSVYAFTAED